MSQPIRILFIHNALTEFVGLDLEELRKKFVVTERFENSRAINPLVLWRQVKAHDLVFGWFASWHTLLPVQFAKLAGKPAVVVVGGYDVANMPEIGYGHQRGGFKRTASRWTVHTATCVVSTSDYSHAEVGRHLGLTNGQTRRIYLGVPDKFGVLPTSVRNRTALTVGNVNRSNLTRKGHEAFVRSAALLPDVKFVLAGDWQDDAIDFLRGIASSNVEFTGRVSERALIDYYRASSVYVQASLHEGFGMSVAEAMLGGCIPVVTRAGALPEVTGESAVFIESTRPTAIAEAIARALSSSDYDRQACRERILKYFPLEQRGRNLEQIVLELTNGKA